MSSFTKNIFSKSQKYFYSYLGFCLPFIIGFLAATQGYLIIPNNISVFVLSIKVYAITMMAGIAFAAWRINNEIKKYQEFSKLKFDDLFVVVTLTGLLGARLFYVLEFWPYYQSNPYEIFAIWHGGLSIFGALLGGVIAILIYAKRTQFAFLKFIDLVALYLPLGQIIGRYGNFVNQEHFGPAANLPWSIYVESTNKYHHPAFLYEQIGNLILFLILKKFYTKFELSKPGALTSIYLIGYGIVRFMIDLFRVDERYLLNLTIAQFIAIGFIALGLFIISIERLKFERNK